MIAIFVRVLDGETPDAILTADMGFIDRTGLKEHLAPTRANALNLMATQMKQRALSFASQPPDSTPMLDFSWFSDPNAWAALATLTVLEIVLGIDNIVFHLDSG